MFENLLASYNPETQTTARKQTGSFYTPREIVNYMVDESLKASLSNLVAEKLVDITEEDMKTGMDRGTEFGGEFEDPKSKHDPVALAFSEYHRSHANSSV